MTEKDQEALKEWWRSRGAIPTTDEEHPLGTRTSDTAIRKDDGEVIMKDDPSLIEKVAREIYPHEPYIDAGGADMSWDELEEHQKMTTIKQAKAALAVVLREVDKREDRDCVAQWLARENGIKLDE
jgi:hypothetical protein